MMEQTQPPNLESEDMSEVKLCPGCNKRKRRLYDWYDEQAGGNIILCEDCMFLREFEKHLISNLGDRDNLKVLTDYEAFGYMKQANYPYQWILLQILIAYFKRQTFLRLDKLLDDWTFKDHDLEGDIIPKMISMNILGSLEEKEIDGTKVKIAKFGNLLETLMKNSLEEIKSTGKAPNIGTVLKIIEGRMGFGVETKNTFKDHIRWKLMNVALKYGFNNSDGTMKREAKVTKTKHFRCKICGEVMDFHFAISKHIIDNHPDIPDEKKDENVEEEVDFIGIKIPRADIAKLDEMVTYGNRFAKILAELFKKDAFFADLNATGDDDVVIIAAPWANVMEKVNMKIKEKIKAKEKIKSN